MKTIILFIIGLLGWLLLTNYQVVYSKVVNFSNPANESTEVVASSDTLSNLETEVLENELEISEVNTTEDNANPIETKLTEVTSTSEEVTDNKLTENPDEVIETAGTKTDVIDETESVMESKIEVEESTDTADAATSKPVTTNEKPKNHPWMQPNTAIPMVQQNMMNPAMMNPSMFMNPMTMMTPMMMGMMAPMMSPAMMMNPNGMMSHPINTMTHPQNMNAMMMSMDPKMMFSMFGQPSKEYLEGKVPDQLPVVTIPGMPTQTFRNWPINKVSPGVSREAKKNAFQTAMAMSPLSMRDMMGIMAEKIPVDEGVSWDDAVEAMKLRANEVNFKFVGSSPLWKEIEAVTGESSAKVEMFRFCDARVARNILDAVPEFIVFLPCKIALLEDGEGKLWVMTMDWDVSWLDYSQNPNSHLSKQIREDAQHIRENLHYIMEGAATGDF